MIHPIYLGLFAIGLTMIVAGTVMSPSFFLLLQRFGVK